MSSPNVSINFKRWSGRIGKYSDDNMIEVDFHSQKTEVHTAKVRFECEDKESRYEYKLFIDGDLMREIWYYKKSKDYDIIMDLIGR
ncbi:MAG: hypothetical protein ACW98X_25965 [Promethearchaeota archaeon]